MSPIGEERRPPGVGGAGGPALREVVAGWSGMGSYRSDAVRAALLAGMAVGYEELTRRSQLARRFLHLHRGPSSTWSNRTSVWTFAAVVVCRPGGPTWWWSRCTGTPAPGRISTAPCRPACCNFATPMLAVGGTEALGAQLHPAGFGCLHGAGVAGTVAAQLLAYTGTGLLAGILFTRPPDRSTPPAAWRTRLPHPTPAPQRLHPGGRRAHRGGAARAGDPHQPVARTGLLTLPAWREAVSTRRAIGQLSTVLLVDFDRFKQINDTHGQLAGDQGPHRRRRLPPHHPARR